MLIVLHCDDLKHRDIIRKILVKSEQQIKIPGPFTIEMEEILTCVHHSIRPSAAHDRTVIFPDLRQCVLNYLLHAYYSRLPLPSTVVKPIVSDVEKISDVCHSLE